MIGTDLWPVSRVMMAPRMGHHWIATWVWNVVGAKSRFLDCAFRRYVEA